MVVGCISAQSIMDGPLWLRWVALAVFIAAGVTDFLDGYYARIWDQQSAFGRMLDPIADKLLVASCLLMLAADSSIHGWTLWAAIVILCREILVSGLREYLAASARQRARDEARKMEDHGAAGRDRLSARRRGRRADRPGRPPRSASLLLWISAIFTIYTGWDYFRAGIHHLIKEDEG